MGHTIDSKLKLNNGVHIPLLGLGTYHLSPSKMARNAILSALQLGYRHIDTAMIHRNETDVGAAIRESGIPRDQVFITTKLWNSDQGYESALAACKQSMKRLGVDYIDLYLIHWPVPERRLESWRALEKLLDYGNCRTIGVSNYQYRHLEELLGECSVVPAVNQVEFHPFLFQRELFLYCKSKSIQLEGYSPLTKGMRLRDPQLQWIAAKYNKTVAQILVRWQLEHDIVTIPKSARANRIRENSQVFDFSISREDMKILNNMNEDLRTSWDPTNVW
ncbi:MAG: aldo/keto reductase [Candidatus Thorarchaeota archaeon]|nr:MAG: aldo/keto reductase [Candidatus Thorarchaeota archaeon]